MVNKACMGEERNQVNQKHNILKVQEKQKT